MIPKSMTLTVNRACNNRCKWCYAQSSGFSNKNMPIERAKKIAQIAIDLKMKKVIILGGEPTMYKPLAEIVKFIRDGGVKVVIVSNSRKFKDYDYAKSIVDAGALSFNVSLKGHDSESYLENTGVDGFDEAIIGYHNLSELHAKIMISIVLVKGFNWEKMTEKLVKIRAKNLFIPACRPALVNNKISDEGMNPQDVVDEVVKAHNVLKHSGIKYKFSPSVPICMFPDGLFDELMSTKSITTCCYVQSGITVVFDNESGVIPCNTFIGNRLGMYGENFTDAESFTKFWESEIPVKFRQSASRYPSEKCIPCSSWKKCGGGCIFRWCVDSPNDFIRGEKNVTDSRELQSA